jgi:hypothetical protein
VRYFKPNIGSKDLLAYSIGLDQYKQEINFKVEKNEYIDKELEKNNKT